MSERHKILCMAGLLLIFGAIAFQAIEQFFGLPGWASIVASSIMGFLIGYFILPTDGCRQ